MTASPAMSRQRITAVAAVLLCGVALALTAAALTHAAWYQNWRCGRMSPEQLAATAQREPGNAVALYYYGKALNAAGRYTEALVPLEHAAGLDPDDARIRQEWSTAQLAGGYITGAFGQLTQFVRVHPNSAEGRAALGRFYVSQNSYERAEEELGQAVARNPRLAEAWSLLAGAQRELGNYVPARDAAQRAVALRPDSAVDHMLLATILTVTNDPDGARREYERAVTLAPNEPAYRCGYARLLLQAGDPKSLALAEEMARRARTLDPNSTEAAFDLGRALILQNRAAEAIEPLTLAASTIPAGMPRSTLAANEPTQFLDPVAALELSRAYRTLGKDVEAHSWQEQYARRLRAADEGRRLLDAVRARPDSAEAHRARALYSARRGDVEGAARDFAAARHAATDAPVVLAETATALAEAGYGALGTPLARRAAIFSPDSPASYEAWGNALLAEGQAHDAAVKFARAAGWWPEKMPQYEKKIAEGMRLRREHPSEAEKLYRQALGLEQANLGAPVNADTAQSLLEKAVAVDPRGTDYRRALLRILVRRHELPQAEQAARELLRLSPEDATANATLALLLLDKAQSEAELSEAESHLNVAEQWANEERSVLPKLHYGRGVVALRRGQGKEAVRLLRLSSEEDPAAELTYFQLVQAERLAGNPAGAEQAQAELTRRQERKQKMFDLLNRIAEKPDDRQRYTDAITFFTQNGMTAQAAAIQMEAKRRFGESKS